MINNTDLHLKKILSKHGHLLKCVSQLKLKITLLRTKKSLQTCAACKLLSQEVFTLILS